MKRKPFIKYLLNLMDLMSFCKKGMNNHYPSWEKIKYGLSTYEIHHGMICWVFTKDKDQF